MDKQTPLMAFEILSIILSFKVILSAGRDIFALQIATPQSSLESVFLYTITVKIKSIKFETIQKHI